MLLSNQDEGRKTPEKTRKEIKKMAKYNNKKNGKKYEVWFGVREHEQVEEQTLMRIGDTILYYEKVNIGKLNNRDHAIRCIHNYYTPDVTIIEKPFNKIIFERKAGINYIKIKEGI